MAVLDIQKSLHIVIFPVLAVVRLDLEKKNISRIVNILMSTNLFGVMMSPSILNALSDDVEEAVGSPKFC